MKVTHAPVVCNCTLALMLLLLAACPAAKQPAEAVKPVTGSAEPTGVISLFNGTGYDKYEPLALDVPHSLDRVFLKKLGPEGLPTLVESYRLGDSLGERIEYVHSSELLRAYVKGHPARDECLLVSHRQDSPEAPVRDVLWKTTVRSKVELDFLAIPGIPEELPVGAAYNTAPFYSWSGDHVVVPLNAGGLCVMDMLTGVQRYIEYPAVPDKPTGRICRGVPDAGGRNLVFLSRWHIGRNGEWCQVNLLDLDSGEWIRTAQILAPGNPARQWVIYEIAGDNLAEEPWLVRGSRAPNKNTENTRIPRLARLDPETGHIELLMFHGDPYWPLALDPSGGFVVFLDRQRLGIVRLDLQAESLEIDTRWYSDEAELLVAPGGAPVFVWNHTELFQAQFTESIELGGE